MQSAFQRFVAVFVSFALAFQGSYAGLAVLEASNALQRMFPRRAPMYTDPVPLHRPAGVSRAPETRGGVWTREKLEDLALSKVQANASPQGPGLHSLSANPAAGGTYNWEGRSQGVNTANGNKLTTLPLFSWKTRGGRTVDFTLYHNSQTAYDDELGKGWTWSYDIYVVKTQTQAIVHYGDGLSVPFAKSGSVYTPPTGVFDDLVENGNGTWTLTEKHGDVYQFNSTGFLTSLTDRNGNALTFTHNGQYYTTRITDATGRYADISLDSNNKFTGVTDPSGKTWTFSYDGSGHLTTVTWPTIGGNTYTDTFTYSGTANIASHTNRRGKTSTYSYNSDDSLAWAKDPLNNQTSYTYRHGYTDITNPISKTSRHNYSSGLLSSVVDEASYSHSFTYNGSNLRLTHTDARGKVWTYTYDSDGNVLTFKNPLNKTWTYTYKSTHELESVEDPYSNETTLTYDSAGNLLTVVDPLSRTVVTNTYDSYGQRLTTKNALNQTTTFTYGTHGDLLTVTNPLSKTWDVAYDSMSRITEVENPLGNATEIEYDVWGRPVAVVYPGNKTQSVTYNPLGSVTYFTNEKSNQTVYAYDDAERLTSVTNAEGDVETYAYNAASWLTGVTNGRSKTRTYAYTDRGELYTLTLPDSSVEQWSYNANGDVSAYTNPLSQTISYVFDDASRNTKVDYPAGTDTEFAYDDADRVTSMLDSIGTTSWTYNAASEVTAFSSPQGNLSYTYDAAGRRSTMVESGGTNTYTYDSAGRLTALNDARNKDFAWTYDDNNRVTKVTYLGQMYADYSYDSRDRLTGLHYKKANHSTVSQEAYVYDDAGNLTQKTVDSVTTDYTYDDIDQMLSEVKSGYSAAYTYDANGNRATRTLNGTTQNYTYDDADKLTEIKVGGTTVKSFGYDAAGRTTGITYSGATTTLAYDYEGRVTSLTRSGSTTNSFTYNGLNARMTRSDSNGSRTMLRDGADVLAPVIKDGSKEYAPGLYQWDSSNGSKPFVTDRLGSVTKITDWQGNSPASKSFDAFGVQQSGGPSDLFGFAGAWGYQSDADHGLQLLGHRMYDPDLGRFLTRDVAKDGLNWYLYCNNNPHKWADPEGKWVWAVVVVGMALWDAYESAKTIRERPNDPWAYLEAAAGLIDKSPGNAGISAIKKIHHGGRLGGGVHRDTIRQIVREHPHWELVAGGGRPEQRVQVGNGRYRYPDITFRDEGGSLIFVNVGDVRKDGRPVSRETGALLDLANIGRTIFYPKRY